MEQEPNQEAQPSTAELAQALIGVVPAEDIEELAVMPFDEALDYSFTLLSMYDVDDPEEYLKSRGILW